VPAGDVIIQLKAKPHEFFERSGNDLLTRVKITLSEALLGFSRVLVTHLDGRGVKVSSPPGKIIKPDQTIVLRGEGMPIYKRLDETGDLYVVLALEMPDESWFNAVNKQVKTFSRRWICIASSFLTGSRISATTQKR
jgi:DnaJ family protein A protein 2